ncbi:MAG: antitoxin family protein [Nitrospirae bacterium]|nr:antitoxin family protein [Nitrospirota bacterium]
MSKVIDAVYENGVFKPMEKVKVKEHEKVTIKVISDDEWKKQFDRIIKKIHKQTAKFSPKEIEADIAEAIKEVREAKRARH